MLNEEGIQEFISKYNSSIEQSTGMFNAQATLIIEGLSAYFSALSKPQIDTFARNVVHKYTENHQKIKQKYLSVIINLTHTKTVKRLFNKWKYLTHGNCNPARTHSIEATYHSQKLNTQSLNDSFIMRQEYYKKKAKAKKERLSSLNEEDLIAQCTFNPKVISTKEQMSPIIRSKRAAERLYEDSNRRLDKYNKKQYESNSNKIKVNTVSNIAKPNKKMVNKLYQDAKEREAAKKVLQQQIDLERGITFKPASYTKDSGYEVSSQFYERNKKLVDDRHNFVFVYDYLRQSKLNDNAVNKKSYPIQKVLKVNETEEENGEENE